MSNDFDEVQNYGVEKRLYCKRKKLSYAEKGLAQVIQNCHPL